MMWRRIFVETRPFDLLCGGRSSKSEVGASLANAIAARMSIMRLIHISCGFENISSFRIAEHERVTTSTVRLTVSWNLRKL